MITKKPYRCSICKKRFETSTNHFGEIYSSPCCGSVRADCMINPDGTERKTYPIRGIRDVERMLKATKTPTPKTRITVQYGFHYIRGNRKPYFSVTADIYELMPRKGWEMTGGGCCHDEVRRHFPELAHLIKWHLVDDDGLPMHAEDNGCYWLEKHHGISKWPAEKYDRTDPLEAFKHTVVFGALPSDSLALSDLLDPLLEGARPDVLNPEIVLQAKRLELATRVRRWLNPRWRPLFEKMKEEMAAASIPFIDPAEYMPKGEPTNV